MGRNSEPEGKVISGNRWSLNASKDKQPHGIGKQSDDDQSMPETLIIGPWRYVPPTLTPLQEVTSLKPHIQMGLGPLAIDSLGSQSRPPSFRIQHRLWSFDETDHSTQRSKVLLF